MSDDFIVELNGTAGIGEKTAAGYQWAPNAGRLFREVRRKREQALISGSIDPVTELSRWESEIRHVSSRCIDPSVAGAAPQRSTQLVVGRVQSGKTSNFTGVIATLADNNFPLFIIIGGTSLDLRDQTVNRLRTDLGASNYEFLVTGESLTSASIKSCAREISTTLSDFLDPRLSEIGQDIKPVCIVALKSTRGHLDVVNELLTEVKKAQKSAGFLASTPTAIVDDECDSATPDGNVNSENDRTAINRAITEIRDLLPNHSYLGYTATPQAQILMGLDDELKPEVVSVLDPGPDYMGVEELFGPDSTYPTEVAQWTGEDVLPDSLKAAFGMFLVQTFLFHHPDPNVRSRYLKAPLVETAEDQPISMLVHVAPGVEPTKRVHDALVRLRQDWIEALGRDASEEGVLEGTTRAVFDDYLSGAFEEVGFPIDAADTSSRLKLRAALREVDIRLIQGGGRTERFPDNREQSTRKAWVFVGAVLLDRGQSLPFLTCSYLGRASGGGAQGGEAGGNVDTLLQRGRFFGYRRQYDRLLKGYFSPSSLASLSSIAQLEPIWRTALKRIDEQGSNLQSLEFFLEMDIKSPRLKPVRANVVPKSTKPVKISTWLGRQASISNESVRNNASLLSDESKLGTFDEGDARNGDFIAALDKKALLRIVESWDFAGDKDTADLFELAVEHAFDKWDLKAIEARLMRREIGNPLSLESEGHYRTGRVQGDEAVLRVDLLSYADQSAFSPLGPTVQFQFLDARYPHSSNVIANALGIAIHVNEPLNGYLTRST